MNFKDAYKEELELYNPEASAERLKEIKRQEERRENIKAIPYFICAILIILFIWWLCSERTEKISKNYEGYIFANSNTFGKDDIIDIPMEPLILTVDGNITYSSKISKEIVAYELTITLKDKNGDILFENYNHCTQVFGANKDNCSFGMSEFVFENGEYVDTNFYGDLSCYDNFENVTLYLFENVVLFGQEGPWAFAAPADSVEGAYNLFIEKYNK